MQQNKTHADDRQKESSECQLRVTCLDNSNAVKSVQNISEKKNQSLLTVVRAAITNAE